MRFSIVPYLLIAAIAGGVIALVEGWFGWSDDAGFALSMLVVLVLIIAAGLHKERIDRERATSRGG